MWGVVLHSVVVASIGRNAAEEGQPLLGLTHGQAGATLCDVGRHGRVRELPKHGHLVECLVVAPHPAQDVGQVADRQPSGDGVRRHLRGTGELFDGLLAPSRQTRGRGRSSSARTKVPAPSSLERSFGQAEVALALVARLEDARLVAVVQYPGTGQAVGPQRTSRIVGGDDLFVEPVQPGAGTTTEQPDGAVHRPRIAGAVKVLDGDEVRLDVPLPGRGVGGALPRDWPAAVRRRRWTAPIRQRHAPGPALRACANESSQ